MTKFLNEDKSKIYKIIQLRLPPNHQEKHLHRSHLVFYTEFVFQAQFQKPHRFNDLPHYCSYVLFQHKKLRKISK